MTRSRVIRTVATLALAAGLTAVMLHAQTTEPASTAKISPEARALLDKVRDTYAKLDGLDLAGSVSINFEGGGQKKTDHADFTSTFRAPNKFRHDIPNEDTIISTGDKVYAYLNERNEYLQADAPKARTDALPEDIASLLLDQDPSLSMTMSKDAADLLINNATDVSLGDDVDVNGTKYVGLKLTAGDEDTLVLIDRNTNLIRQVRHDLMRSYKERGVPNLVTAMATIDYSSSTTGNTPAQFAWTPPADAKPMKIATDAGGEGGEAAVALEGKPAPAFTLKDPDGKSVSMSELKGHVVVLDFWATWCGPCRAGLPIVDKVTASHAKDGVKAYAVNLREDAGKVSAFLKEQNLSITALLDSDGAVANKYSVSGIPQTVIIGKDGVVRKVIVGYGEGEEQTLNSAIETAMKS